MIWVVDELTSLQVACSDKLQLTVVIIIMNCELWINRGFWIILGVYKKRNGRAIALPLSPNNHRLTTI